MADCTIDITMEFNIGYDDENPEAAKLQTAAADLYFQDVRFQTVTGRTWDLEWEELPPRLRTAPKTTAHLENPPAIL